MSKALAPLDAHSLVETRTDPQDGRRRRLRLTNADRAAAGGIHAAKNAWLRQQLATLAPEERARLVDAFHRAGRPVVSAHAMDLPAGYVARPVPESAELSAGYAHLDGRLPSEPQDLHIDKDRPVSALTTRSASSRCASRVGAARRA